uniref:Uncharacterized protein n=1 Tax=Parascaris univalens TaxID=6257 RepID=A0A915B8G7_PARUN
MVEVRRRSSHCTTGKSVPHKTTKKAAEQSINSLANKIKERRLKAVDWRTFDTIIFIQGALGLIHVFAGIAAAAVGQLSPWAFFSTALLLFLTVVPAVHQVITEDETDAVVLFGWLQTVSAVCCLFFVTVNLLDFTCNDLEWRAYFTLSVAFWQFVSVIIISLLPSEKASLSEIYKWMLRRKKERETVCKTARPFPHKTSSDMSTVVVHHNESKEEPSDSYLQKLATYLEKELLRKREQKKRLKRITAEMKTKWYASKRRSHSVADANYSNSAIESAKKASQEGEHSKTPQRVLQVKMSSNMPKSDVVKTEANKRNDNEGKNNKVSDQRTQTSGNKDSVLTSKR